MFKKSLLVSVLLCLSFGLRAQNEPTVYESASEAGRLTVLDNVSGGMIQLIKDNRYLSGPVDRTYGFSYDIEAKELKRYNVAVQALFSDNHYIASSAGDLPVSYLHLNGEDIALERTVNTAGDPTVEFWNTTPDGKYFVALSYEDVSTSYGETLSNHVGIVYDGQTGKIKTLLHSYWPRKEDPNEDNIGYGTRATAISADGTVVGGHGAWPSSLPLSNCQPMFWDLALPDADKKTDYTVYAIEDPKFSMADLVDANSDGSVLVGTNEETNQGLIIRYSRADKQFTYE
ncbi:MAG: hypothetical protein K2L03_00165, partial [Bacteroidales bacterium]|nr:hypothetical protein [Bacteroidales bacterium]